MERSQLETTLNELLGQQFNWSKDTMKQLRAKWVFFYDVPARYEMYQAEVAGLAGQQQPPPQADGSTPAPVMQQVQGGGPPPQAQPAPQYQQPQQQQTAQAQQFGGDGQYYIGKNVIELFQGMGVGQGGLVQKAAEMGQEAIGDVVGFVGEKKPARKMVKNILSTAFKEMDKASKGK